MRKTWEEGSVLVRVILCTGGFLLVLEDGGRKGRGMAKVWGCWMDAAGREAKAGS